VLYWNGLIQFTLFQTGKFNSKVEQSPGAGCFRSSRFHCKFADVRLWSWFEIYFYVKSPISQESQNCVKFLYYVLYCYVCE
jgi:hypothetical protein